MNHRRVQLHLAPLLKPLSRGYAAAMHLRAWSYAKGIKKSSRPEPFCISVGNISWGGSGKTPLVSWLLDWAGQNALKAAVLTRGYGGKTANRPLLVRASTSPLESGDEPLMLALMHPEAQILADPDRRRALSWSRKHAPADLYILDDGMQHLALTRDLNLVVLKPDDLLDEWNKVIPAGSWREGKKALGRADAFMLRVRENRFEELATAAEEKLAEFKTPLFSFDLRPGKITPLTAHPEPDTAPVTESLKKSGLTVPYALCAAVGTPESVLESARQALGATPDEMFIFPDHHPYTLQDLQQICAPGLPVLTTAKDAVKIRPLLNQIPERRFFVLAAEIKFGPVLFTDTPFAAWLNSRKENPA